MRRRDGNKLKIIFSNEYGGPDIETLVDHVFIEHGTLPLKDLYHECRSTSKNDGTTDQDALMRGGMNADGAYMLFRVGDAVASRNVHAAIYDSLRLCKDL